MEKVLSLGYSLDRVEKFLQELARKKFGATEVILK